MQSVGFYNGHFECYWLCVEKTRCYWWQVKVGLGNGLVPSSNKPLADPDLCHHMASLDHNELNLRNRFLSIAYEKRFTWHGSSVTDGMDPPEEVLFLVTGIVWVSTDRTKYGKKYSKEQLYQICNKNELMEFKNPIGHAHSPVPHWY